MPDDPTPFYEELADYYHLIFEDWDLSIARQAKTLNSLLISHLGSSPLHILDCACGIGTQSIGLAQLGHHVVASDLSPAAVHRARNEARQRNLPIQFHASDMTHLKEIEHTGFDAVITLDNALPHLDRLQLIDATKAIASKLRPNGLFIASIRDYDTLIQEKPAMQKPAFYGPPGKRRIVHQVWDWTGNKEDSRYQMHLYITTQSDQGWRTQHFVSEYRCLLRHEFSTALSNAGFHDIQWLTPAESGFYQPIVLARSPA